MRPLAIAVILFASAARSQPADPVPVTSLPPASQLGLRVEALRRQIAVSPVVVVVEDEASYAEAIARWTPTLRYPVLLDDGSLESRQDVARFVRAFGPQRVLRWSGGEPWPVDALARRVRIEAALAASWEVDARDGNPLAQLLDAWGDSQVTMPGVVVANPADPAWTAALALASFRAQPIVWLDARRNINHALELDEIDDLCRRLEAELDGIGAPWRALGDRIDAVALCMATPVKYRLAENEIRASTDRIGRLASGTRWAWCGQIFGTSARASYQAMCSLFLSPRSALLFDGYPNEGAWAQYDIQPAAESLQSVGVEVVTRDLPRGTRDEWLRLAARPLHAGIIHVNTKGLRTWFDLQPGRVRPGNLPQLQIPSIVHFIHSWSAVQPELRHTIAARWLERGVYAYAGAVDEPFLNAFVTPEAFIARLRMAFPFAAAVRFDSGPVWKVATFGDPLTTIGAALARVDVPPSLDGAADLGLELPDQLQREDFAGALRTLELLGRDEDAARLVGGLVRDRPEAITPDVADAAIMPVSRAGSPSDFFALFQRLDDARSREPQRLDALWNATRLLASTADGPEDLPTLRYLRTRLREDQTGQDASDLADAIARADSPQEAIAFLRSLSVTAQDDTRIIAEAVRRLSGGR